MRKLLEIDAEGRWHFLPVRDVEIMAWYRKKKAKKLLSVLRRNDLSDYLRGMAAMALGKLNVRGAVPDLIERADREEAPYLCTKCVEALGEINDPRAYDVLGRAAQSRNAKLRRKAIEALGGLIGDENADYLARLLAYPDDDVKEAALIALCRSQVTDRLDRMVPFLSHENRHLRLVAASCIDRLRDPRAIPALLSAARLDGGQNGVALQALSRFSPEELGGSLDEVRRLRAAANGVPAA